MNERPNGTPTDNVPTVEQTVRTDERSIVSVLAAYANKVRDGYRVMANEAPSDGIKREFSGMATAWEQIRVCLRQAVERTMLGKPALDPRTVGESLLQQMRQHAQMVDTIKADIEAANGNGKLDTEMPFSQDEADAQR